MIVLLLPPDVQKIMLSYLWWEDLLQLRTTNSHYRDVITNDCQELWNGYITLRWPNGKGKTPLLHHNHHYGGKQSNIDFINWSATNNWNIHPPQNYSTVVLGFQEFHRRSLSDHRTVELLRTLSLECISVHHLPPRFPGEEIVQIRGMTESEDNSNWISLMKSGEDCIDCVKKYIIRKKKYLTSFLFSNDFLVLEEASRDYRYAKKCVQNSVKVLGGIWRLAFCQQLRYHLDSTMKSEEEQQQSLIETGAISIAKFYATISCSVDDDGDDDDDGGGGGGGGGEKDMEKLIHGIEENVESQFLELTNIIKLRLGNRLGQNENYPLMEVIEEMRSIFGEDEEDEDKFRGNSANYYDAKNSLLDEVMLRKKGIPITLAIVYATLVRRVCGACLDIIGLPGHIVIGLPFKGSTPYFERKFVDVFHGGRLLSYSDLRSIVSRYGIAWCDEMAEPISHQQVWLRMLRNITNCHSRHVQSKDLRILAALQSVVRVGNFEQMVLAPGFAACDPRVI